MHQICLFAIALIMPLTLALGAQSALPDTSDLAAAAVPGKAILGEYAPFSGVGKRGVSHGERQRPHWPDDGSNTDPYPAVRCQLRFHHAAGRQDFGCQRQHRVGFDRRSAVVLRSDPGQAPRPCGVRFFRPDTCIRQAARSSTRLESLSASPGSDGSPATRIPQPKPGISSRPASTPFASSGPIRPFQAQLPTMDKVVTAAGIHGLKVIFDHHANETPGPHNSWLPQQPNGLPIDKGPGTDGTDGAGDRGTVDLARLVGDWVLVARRYAGNATVLGFDLHNEPLSYPGKATWGDGGPRDLRAIYIQAGNAIQAVNPDGLIIAEGPQNYNTNFAGTGQAPYGDLSRAADFPVTLKIPNKVVYSVHHYPPTISGYKGPNKGPRAIANMNASFGYLVTQNIAPVWIGEMGGSLDGTSESAGANLAIEQEWAQSVLDT